VVLKEKKRRLSSWVMNASGAHPCSYLEGKRKGRLWRGSASQKASPQFEWSVVILPKDPEPATKRRRKPLACVQVPTSKPQNERTSFPSRHPYQKMAKRKQFFFYGPLTCLCRYSSTRIALERMKHPTIRSLGFVIKEQTLQFGQIDRARAQTEQTVVFVGKKFVYLNICG
jgi:hypothetical protein